MSSPSRQDHRKSATVYQLSLTKTLYLSRLLLIRKLLPLKRITMFQDEMEDLYWGLSPDVLCEYAPIDIDCHLEEEASIPSWNADISWEQGWDTKQNLLDSNVAELCFAANPSDITGQSLASKTKNDEATALQDLAVSETEMYSAKEAVGPIHADMLEADTSMKEPLDATQELIDYMHEFLKQYEEEHDKNSENDSIDLSSQMLTLEQQLNLSYEDGGCPVSNSILTSDEISAAGELLDSLLEYSETEFNAPGSDDRYFLEAEKLLKEPKGKVIEDGENVIIVLEPNEHSNDTGVPGRSMEGLPRSSEDKKDCGLLPFMSSTASEKLSYSSPMDDVDEALSETKEQLPTKEVSSQMIKKRPGRKVHPRHSTLSGKASRKFSNIKDKKERKKLQNVEAARRYRDKKKMKLLIFDEEEKRLQLRNKELKWKLSHLQDELGTFKKWMSKISLEKFLSQS